MKRFFAWLSVIAGSLMALLGLMFIGMYVVKGWVERIGDPDQSLIFWYLPILFIGVIGAVGGVGLVILGATLRRSACRTLTTEGARLRQSTSSGKQETRRRGH